MNGLKTILRNGKLSLLQIQYDLTNTHTRTPTHTDTNENPALNPQNAAIIWELSVGVSWCPETTETPSDRFPAGRRRLRKSSYGPRKIMTPFAERLLIMHPALHRLHPHPLKCCCSMQGTLGSARHARSRATPSLNRSASEQPARNAAFLALGADTQIIKA